MTEVSVVLDELDLDRDAADLHVALGDPAVSEAWLGWTPSRHVGETRARLAERAALPGACLWSIRETSDGPALGIVERIGGVPGAGHGLTWMIRRSHWGRGLTGTAAGIITERLLRDGARSVEAWADSGNIASIRVAQRAGLSERARFALAEDGHITEKVVLGRLRDTAPLDLYSASPVLLVRDVEATSALLRTALGFSLGFHMGQPMRYAQMRVGPWSNAPGIRLRRADGDGDIAPAIVDIESGSRIADLHRRAAAAGAHVESPAVLPWGRIEFAVLLPEGHRLEISGAAM